MSWVRIGAIATGVIGALGALFTYLPFAKDEGWFPYGPHAQVKIDAPGEGYRSSGGFSVRLSGDAGSSDHVWIAALDSANAWYPLAEAVPAGKGRWSAPVSAGQIQPPVSLCAVVADEQADVSFDKFLGRSDQVSGFPELPQGAERAECRRIEPGAGQQSPA